MSRTISLIVLALMTAAVVVPIASSGTPTASCSQADDPSGCYQGRPFIDPLAVSYLGGMGLTRGPDQGLDGRCVLAREQARSVRRRVPADVGVHADAHVEQRLRVGRRDHRRGGDARRRAPARWSRRDPRHVATRPQAHDRQRLSTPAAYLLSRRPENGPLQGSFSSASEARPARNGSGCHNSDITNATPRCAAKLRDGGICRSVPATGDLSRTPCATRRRARPRERSSTAITPRSGAPASGTRVALACRPRTSRPPRRVGFQRSASPDCWSGLSKSYSLIWNFKNFAIGHGAVAVRHVLDAVAIARRISPATCSYRSVGSLLSTLTFSMVLVILAQ